MTVGLFSMMTSGNTAADLQFPQPLSPGVSLCRSPGNLERELSTMLDSKLIDVEVENHTSPNCNQHQLISPLQLVRAVGNRPTIVNLAGEVTTVERVEQSYKSRNIPKASQVVTP